MNTEQVAELLGRLLVPDTAVIKQAEAQLGQFCREPVSIVRLLEVASLCPNADIRLYALVVLKKRISSLWNKLQLSDREAVQQVPPLPHNPKPVTFLAVLVSTHVF